MWLLREVWLASGSLNEFLWTPSLALNVVEVNPMYVLVVLSVCVTVAWYTNSLVRHFPPRGQIEFSLQLHILTSWSSGGESSLAFLALIMASRF